MKALRPSFLLKNLHRGSDYVKISSPTKKNKKHSVKVLAQKAMIHSIYQILEILAGIYAQRHWKGPRKPMVNFQNELHLL